MYVSCVAQDRKRGLLQPSFETLHAKGEAIRMVQDTIAACGSQVPQSIILAMTLLAYGCGADQAWDEARGHVEALQHVLSMRGGIQTLDFELQRTVSWATLSLAATLRMPPRFPISLFPEFRPFPLAFHDDAQIRAWRTVKRFPKDTSFVFDLVLRFHQLGLATSVEWYNDIDQRSLSNLYFEAMHSAVLVPLEEPWNETLPGGVQGQEAATMFKVWAAGLPLFVWATARHTKAQSGTSLPRSRYDPIFVRIRGLLESDGGYHAWPRKKSLEPVMATLFYVVESCEYGDPWRLWCVDTLRKVAELLKLKGVEDFQKALEFFPSTDVFRAVSGDLWSEMMHGSVASTPSLTLSVMQ
ncbi:hypothetical protein K458DRAFT_102141 [Lentithecium fluviatile CBS 122367]|uniref:Transcription factor domain-containing protein n=1 Tax=Lentithecium fluviatile CBS 122367 TaxID=1168545 RepID=A0A6G1JIQ4_9PLEO|nr:hypothetical protein K458DRAFT_102141 [Lentithecium fluviatile CBS 122367]